MSAKLMDLWCAASKGVGLSHQRTVAKYRGKWGTPIRLLDGQEATMLGCGGLYGACHDYHNVGAYLLFGGLNTNRSPNEEPTGGHELVASREASADRESCWLQDGLIIGPITNLLGYVLGLLAAGWRPRAPFGSR